MIFYPIESLVSAGVTEIMVVTGGNHAGEFLRLLKSGKEFGCTSLQYAYQEQAGGIAEALGLAQEFIDQDKCVVVLGDNILGESIRTEKPSTMSRSMARTGSVRSFELCDS